MFKRLKVFQILSLENRITSIDIFRGFAIIGVVLFHFNNCLPYGYIGVDLFFVISGLLVGGILTKSFAGKESINYFKFILQRGFKIWPSFYVFIIAGTAFAYIFYNSLDPSQIIPLKEMKRYLLFYQNYTGAPFHWCFDHIWSLCVEEHFYIFLPLLFIIVQRIFKEKNFLFLFISLTIFSGIIFKLLAQLYTHSKDTYSATHNRLDALAWGVLLNLILTYYNSWFKKINKHFIIFFAGLALFVLAIYLEINTHFIIYHKIIFHSLLPFCFFLMIAGVYYYNFSKLKVVRVIAYYSFNWYLWHPLFVKIIIHKIGYNVWGVAVYLTVSFMFAVIFTILIEETFLSKRKFILNKLFKDSGVAAMK